MAKIKRVFVVEGIDDGKIVGSELIKATNLLLEEDGLEVSSTAREKILSDVLTPGTSGRVLAFMTHTDFSKYAKPGGVKSFVDAALETQADVTEVLKMINGGLKDPAGWLQVPALTSKRMPLSALNGPEDTAVVLNVPKSLLNFTKPVGGKEGAAALLEKIMSHNNFQAAVNTNQAKQGVPKLDATTVGELLNHFNFDSILSYKQKDVRIDALAEWKKAKETQASAGAAKKSDSDAIESPAHQFADWIEEYRLEHRLPKTESAAYEFYFKAKAKLDELSNGSAKLRRAAREAGVKMVRPDSGLWEKLATGDIDGYMKIIKARAEAAGETLPKDDKPAKKPEDEPKADAKKDETLFDFTGEFGANKKPPRASVSWGITIPEPGKFKLKFRNEDIDSPTSNIDDMSMDGDVVVVKTGGKTYKLPLEFLNLDETDKSLWNSEETKNFSRRDMVKYVEKQLGGKSSSPDEKVKAATAEPSDLPAPLERLAATLASGIKDNKAWDPKHKGSLLAAVEKALSGK